MRAGQCGVCGRPVHRAGSDVGAPSRAGASAGRWAERDAARGGAGLVEALRPGPDRAEPRRLGPAEERASWAEVGPREGRGRPGPCWAGPGLLLGWVLVVSLGFLFSYSSPF